MLQHASYCNASECFSVELLASGQIWYAEHRLAKAVWAIGVHDLALQSHAKFTMPIQNLASISRSSASLSLVLS